MSLLTIHTEEHPERAEVVRDADEIAERLARIGVRFERWDAEAPLDRDAGSDQVLAAYATSIERLKSAYGFESADVIAVSPDHPEKAALRAKFLAEHIHTDFEVRFFVEGRGLFFLHPDDHVYSVLCEKGDLLSVPAHAKHWFDMGAEPFLRCIRLFTTPEGWVAQFTGSPIASSFPSLEEFLRVYG